MTKLWRPGVQLVVNITVRFDSIRRVSFSNFDFSREIIKKLSVRFTLGEKAGFLSYGVE